MSSLPPPMLALDRVEAALDACRYREAWNAARLLPDLRSWRGARERRLAYRLAGHLGAPRLSAALARRLYREHPGERQAILTSLPQLLDDRGPLPAWDAVERAWPHFEAATAEEHSELLTFRALVATALRDFDSADADLERAFALCQHPWNWVRRAHCLEARDRLEEATACCDEALRQRPGYWPALAVKVGLLRSSGDDHRALLLLFEAAGRVDHPGLLMQMAQLQMDLGFWADADESIRLFGDNAPLLAYDRAGTAQIDLLRAHVAYRRGDYEKAAQLYLGTELPFAAALAERLRQDPASARRRLLEVPWQRQHHRTCSPATLTSICRYWGLPAEHLEIAEAICYDGTPGHSERRWARENGLVHQEFTVDWEIAVALIDRGVPFALVTSDAVSAHIQVVAGYDSFRKSFLCRDPSVRHWVEHDAETLLTVLAATGPRGLVLLPPSEAARLAGLELPDRELYDLYDRIEASLAAHQRDAAEAALAELSARAPGHRLELSGRASLASYDGNAPRSLAVIEAQLERYPHFARYRLLRLQLLAQLGRPEQRIAELEKLVAEGKDPHFSFLLAQTLLGDARHEVRASRLILRALRRRFDHGPGYAMLVTLAEARGDRERALRLQRWAACLAVGNEGPHFAYFAACRGGGRTGDGLRYLERRVERLGQLSGDPAITLASALESLDRNDEALAVIAAALARRPNDPELLIDQVGRLLRSGRVEEGRRQLASLEGRVEKASFLSLHASFAEIDGNFDQALADLHAMLELDPTSIELYGRISYLEASYRGRKAAVAFLAAARDRFPHHIPLAEMQVGFCREGSLPEARAVVRQLLELDPTNAWAWRESADLAMREGEWDAASAALAQAEAIDPRSSALLNLRGNFAELRGDHAAATRLYREAVAAMVDNVWAQKQLLRISADAEAQRENLRWLVPHLLKSLEGSALLWFWGPARRYLPPEEVLAILQRLQQERGDLWQSHAILGRQLQAMGRGDQGLAVLQQAIARFPHKVGLWRAVAELHSDAHRQEPEREALLRLLEIEPTDIGARLELAYDYLEADQVEAARHHYQQGLARNPNAAALHRLGAEIHRAQQEYEPALAAALKAIELHADDLAEWRRLRAYARLAGREPAALAAARQMLERRGDGWSYLVVGRLTDDPAEARAALAKAVELEPLAVEGHLEYVQLLREQGDFPAALRACRPPAFGGPGGKIPLELRSAAAEILHQQGQVAMAIDTLKKAVAEDPGFVAGLAQLCEWYADAKNWSLVEPAAERWLALAPTEGPPWGYRALARLETGREALAKEDLKQAIAADPTYRWALFRLADLEEKKSLGGALEVLAAASSYPQEPLYWARLCQTAARAGGDPRLQEWLERLAQEPEAEIDHLSLVVCSLAEKCPQGLAAYDVLATAPATKAPLLEGRLDRLAQQKGFDAAWQFLAPQRDQPERWSRAAAFLLSREISAGKQVYGGHIERLLLQYRVELRRSTPTWGWIGHYFLEESKPRRVIAWMEDFAQRPGVSCWHLLQLSVAHLLLNENLKAWQVSMEALRLPEAGESVAHRYIVAFWEALEGHGEKAAALRLDGEDRYVDFARLAKAAAVVLGKRGDRQALDQAYRYLQHPSNEPGCEKAIDWDQTLLRMYNTVIRHIARQIGGWRAWSYYLLRQQPVRSMG